MSLEPPSLPPEPPEPPTPPFPTRPAFLVKVVDPSLAALHTGWARAALSAVVVFAIVYALSVVLALFQNEGSQHALDALLGGQSLPDLYGQPSVPRAALFSLMTWHGVSFDAGFGLSGGPFPPGTSFAISASITLMLGLAVTGYLLFRAAKSLASRHQVAGWFSILRGLQIALVYAPLVFALGLLAGVDIAIPQAAGQPAGFPQSISIQPSLVGAFFMPFLLAAFAAGAGALSGRLRPRERLTRLAVAGIAGGWRAAWLAVALASIGFLILAALHPDATRAFLDVLPGGGWSRTIIVISTLLLLPNIGTGIAAAAMGGSINVTNFMTFRGSCALISYVKFPAGIAETPGAPTQTECGFPIDLGSAPAAYLLFLLVPLAATIAGGWLAAQRAEATDTREGAVAGATIGISYAWWLWVLALMARIGYGAAVGINVQVWIGPGLVSTILLALVWGAAGGAIGGAFGARNASRPGIIPGPLANDSG